ncbi:MAG: AbrB/MazE/SpoVT family DNA-binding domain-containing protein [Oscillospiraceae bacterium]|nr:AbrB/MazE/SpoVT family DNA-binding domain-containing protein [Oscillospiraceae bacterium]
MELAKVTSKGQITIPIEIRRFLGVKDGDKVMFVQDGNRVVMMNASLNALMELQTAFAGVAEEQGIRDEQDVVDMVKEIRRERSGDTSDKNPEIHR